MERYYFITEITHHGHETRYTASEEKIHEIAQIISKRNDFGFDRGIYYDYSKNPTFTNALEILKHDLKSFKIEELY